MHVSFTSVCVEYGKGRCLHLPYCLTRLVSNLENYLVYLGARRFHIRYLCLVFGINIFETLK